MFDSALGNSIDDSIHFVRAKSKKGTLAKPSVKVRSAILI
jgi:hypothetical protein